MVVNNDNLFKLLTSSLVFFLFAVTNCCTHRLVAQAILNLPEKRHRPNLVFYAQSTSTVI